MKLFVYIGNFIKKYIKSIIWTVEIHYFKRDGKYNRVLEIKEDSNEIKAINERLEELKDQMMNLLRLNVRSGLDNQIYGEEYERLTRNVAIKRK